MDTLFFWVSKLIWLIVSPDMLFVFVFVVGWLLLCTGKVRCAMVVYTFLVLFIGAVTVLPMGRWLLAPLENRFSVHPELPEKVDGIIMLGGAENAYKSSLWGQPEIRENGERYLGFVQLINHYPDARRFFSGGSANLTRPDAKDAWVARQVLEMLGQDVSKIVFEESSRNTYENAKFTKALADPKPGQNWILVTSASHMPRAVGVFEKLDWQVIPYPVDYYTYKGETLGLTFNFAANLHGLSLACREWLGLAAYYVTGKTSALIPPVNGSLSAQGTLEPAE